MEWPGSCDFDVEISRADANSECIIDWVVMLLLFGLVDF